MLKCPACGRSGGPFRLRQQAVADGQLIRAWCCPCGQTFHALAGAERAPGVQGHYPGFAQEWNGRSFQVGLERISKQDVLWSLGPWTINVSGPHMGPGARQVTLWDAGDEPVGNWRLEPGWGAAEILRRIRARALPDQLEPELLARLLYRLLN